MINIIDSGIGAYNLKGYLIEIGGKKYNKEVEVLLTPNHVGDKSEYEIKKDFYNTVKGVPKKEIYLGCNTLNSVLPQYKGVFIQLLEYIKNNNHKKLLILCTTQTKNQLTKFKFKNTTVLNLNIEVVKQIDDGYIPNLNLNTDLFSEIILGCTHYDQININTNLKVISTSKLGAYNLKQIIDDKKNKRGC